MVEIKSLVDAFGFMIGIPRCYYFFTNNNPSKETYLLIGLFYIGWQLRMLNLKENDDGRKK